MKKLMGLMGLVAALGCAKGNDIEHPSPQGVMNIDDSGHIIDGSRTINVSYLGPEDETADSAVDDIISISMYEPFYNVDTFNFHVGGSGQVYAFGFLLSYDIVNDNDGNALNNVMEFSVRHW